ncbi:MAG: hypothetical protein BWY15_01719 [Firmicutes bacterium ADurb.Bin193]|nr:MAG: hypothetical protein BWY15_01719 [Firmicutes bacterium ADurb.Bin193]
MNFIFGKGNIKSSEKYSEADKIKAAHALNMCLVSISQIIDYNDLYILDQEYDGILNNLNLQHMPKDEALLKIIKQTLDVITFFRKQEGEKKLIEAEYQQKMKNAIWSAVPNIAAVVVSSNPIAIATSLATQVGIGYMNYRRAKSEHELDKNRKEWELYEAAMEQFNGLRRELFDTAWRLADEYDFPDEYRLTERQISNYNEILMDTDLIRRYERLEYIKDNFKAYPHFWYFFGHAANRIAFEFQGENEQIAAEYTHKAIAHFKEYEKINDYGTNNLLREDQIYSTCALEHIDLLLKNKGYNQLDSNQKEEIIKLLDVAIKCSGDKNDILQLCMITYLKIGKIEQAITILKQLVNSSYNVEVNALLLSKIYSDKKDRTAHKLLSSRVEETYIYPIDTGENTLAEYIASRKYNLALRSSNIINECINLQKTKYTGILISNEDIEKRGILFSEWYNDLLEIIQELPCRNQREIKEKINENIKNQEDQFKSLFGVNMCEIKEFNVKVDDIVNQDVLNLVYTNVADTIYKLCDMEQISQYETNLADFSAKNRIGNDCDNSIATPYTVLYKTNALQKLVTACDTDKENQLVDKFNKHKDRLLNSNDDKTNKKVEIYIKGDKEFYDYFGRHREYQELGIIAVLNDKGITDKDLIFTTKGVFVSLRNSTLYKWCKRIGLYPLAVVDIIRELSNEIVCYGDIVGKDKKQDALSEKISIGNYMYSNKYVNINELYALIDDMAKITDPNTHTSASVLSLYKKKINK